MTRSSRRLTSALTAVPLGMALVGAAGAQDLQSFAVISGQSLTNTGPTTIGGNIAVSPGTSFTGRGSVTQTGETYLTDGVAGRAQNDLTTLYNVLQGRPTSSGGNLTGKDLGGLTLSAGVYNFDTSAALASGQTLTLDGGGNPDAVFIFNVGSTLTMGSASAVKLQNGAQGGNVFYRIGSSATVDTTADVVGQIVALTSISMNTAATLSCGAAYARNGSITLDTNTIQVCTLESTGFDDVAEDPTLTDDERAVAEALAEHVKGGGKLPIGIAILAPVLTPNVPIIGEPPTGTPGEPGVGTPVETPNELAISLARLTGEVSTGLAPMVMRTTDTFLDTVLRTGRMPRTRDITPPAGNRPPAGNQPPVGTPPQDDTPVGMVREQINTPYSAKYDSEPVPVTAPLAYAAPSVAQMRNWDVWISGYGSRNEIDGDTGEGREDFSSDNRGVAAGLNLSLSNNTDIGIAISKATADYTLGNDFGSGSSDTVFVALRGRTETSRGYIEGALAYGQSDISTDRTVTIAGSDRFISEAEADTIAAHIEAGYHLGRFTPFVGLRAQSFETPAYDESVAAGSSTYALRYDENTTTSVRSELGFSMEWLADTPSRNASVGLRAAWAHEFASNDASSRSFLALPGVAFDASGAPEERDSLNLSATASLIADNGVYVDGAIRTDYSSIAQDYSASLRVGYRW